MNLDALHAAIDQQSLNIKGLMENQLLLTAQVQVLQAALATVLLHHADRPTLLRSFRGYMKITKQSTPQLAVHMEALEAGMLAMLGHGTESDAA